jgi:hypothetical protein
VVKQVHRLEPLAPFADRINGKLLTWVIMANLVAFTLAALALAGVPTTSFWPIISTLLRLTATGTL